ncbi:methyltransferase domain-containing protein [Methylorubrum extorquens]
MQVVEKCTGDEVHRRAAELILQVSSVMDIGCGIRPQQFVSPETLICVEPFKDYVDILKDNLKNCNVVIVPADAHAALSAMPSRSVDSIFLLDVIEHMTEQAGLAVISECERVARKQIILYTPLGFMPQEVHALERDAWKLNGGKFQEHLSGWTPDDFSGYHILCCDDLHKFDFRGRPIDPAFGGFYAIKTFATEGDNEGDRTSYVSIKNNVPYSVVSLIKETKTTNACRANLEIGIKSCQFTTEMLISPVGDQGVLEIQRLAECWRNENRQTLQSEFSKYYNALIESFVGLEANSEMASINWDPGADVLRPVGDIDTYAERTARQIELTRREQQMLEKEALLIGHEANLNSWNKDILRREKWVAEKEISLAGHESNLSSWEADICRREDWIKEKLMQLEGHESNLNNWEADIRRREIAMGMLTESPDRSGKNSR